MPPEGRRQVFKRSLQLLLPSPSPPLPLLPNIEGEILGASKGREGNEDLETSEKSKIPKTPSGNWQAGRQAGHNLFKKEERRWTPKEAQQGRAGEIVGCSWKHGMS